MTATYREAAAPDLRAIIALLNDDAFGKARNPLFDAQVTVYSAAFDEILADPNNGYVIAEEGGVVVGCYQLTFIRGLSYTGGVRAQIESVRIAAERRGCGLGSAMMRDAVVRAQSRRCTLVQLTTDTRRDQTRRFYERLGFSTSHHGMKLWL